MGKRAAAAKASVAASATASQPAAQLPPDGLHPTLSRLAKLLDTPEVRALAKAAKQSKGRAGIDAFDPAAYKVAMKQCKEYTCVVSATEVDARLTVHPNIIPAWGTLQLRPQISCNHIFVVSRVNFCVKIYLATPCRCQGGCSSIFGPRLTQSWRLRTA